LRDRVKLKNNSTSLNAPASVQRHAVNGVILALALLSIYFLSRAVLTVLAPESQWQSLEPAPLRTSGNGQAASSRLNVEFDPFHRGGAISDEIIEIGTDAPETTLNLKLFGRRAGQDGSAILETADKSQKVFRIGDEIMNGVTLKAVHPDYIVLSQGGRIERLTFERDTQSALIAESQPSKEKFTTPIKSIPKSMTISRFTSGVNLAPELRGGQMTGFRITPKNGSIDLNELGLKSGDVITSISGVDLTSPNLNPVDLTAKLSGRTRLRLNVLRGSDTIFINIGSQ